MPQNQSPVPLSARLAERRGDLQYAMGVRLRDALRTAQSHAWKTTWFFWLGAFLMLIGLLLGIAARGSPANAGERYALDGLGALYVLGALALLGMHIETRHRERKWRSETHGGDNHPAR